MRNLLFLSLLLCASATAPAQDDGAPSLDGFYLPVGGRVTDGENKLAGCEVLLYRGTELVNSLTTDKSGRFEVNLDLNETWGIEFRKAGFVSKRMVFDTHLPKMKADSEFIIEPMVMEVGMLEKARYDGANTDELDFPFAIVKWNRALGGFTQDQEYTMGMQRTNGALLLMAARSEQK